MAITTPLDVLSVDEVKQELIIDFDDDNDLIARKIKSAISLIEQDTAWRFYPRTETMQTSSRIVQIFQYPLTSVSAANEDAETITFDRTDWPLRVNLDFECVTGVKTLTLSTGASELTEIPETLREAIIRLVVYLYEERNNNKAVIPNDVQEMISKFRRFTYF